MEGRVLRDHLGSDASSFTVSGGRKGTEKSRIVVGRGTKGVTGSIEAKAPGVVVELVQKGDLGTIGSHVKDAVPEANLILSLATSITGIAHRAPNAIVQTIAKIGRTSVGISHSPTGIEDFSHVGHVIPVGVLEKKKIRSVSHDDSTIGKHN